MTVLPIGTPPRRRIAFSRRRIMQLGLAGAVGGTLAACAPASDTAAPKAIVDGIVPWPDDLRVPPVFAPGYGMFPDYDAIGETGPWPKILSDLHKSQLERFSDLILPATDTAPAPSEVGIADFFDDWTSAPYPWMTGTRGLVHRGFAWLDAQGMHDHGADWLGLSDDQARGQLDRMMEASLADDPPAHLAQPAEMYTHLRHLVIGAYYTTPEGEADLGHAPNQPLTGDYPGPTGEALDHILGVIAAQGLSSDDLPIGPPPYADAAPYSFTGDEPA